MAEWKYKPLTEEQKAAEDKLVNSPENLKNGRAMIDAYLAGNQEEFDRLMKKVIQPVSLLRGLGKGFVKSKGMPTITCEMINDTEWLND